MNTNTHTIGIDGNMPKVVRGVCENVYGGWEDNKFESSRRYPIRIVLRKNPAVKVLPCTLTL